MRLHLDLSHASQPQIAPQTYTRDRLGSGAQSCAAFSCRERELSALHHRAARDSCNPALCAEVRSLSLAVLMPGQPAHWLRI